MTIPAAFKSTFIAATLGASGCAHTMSPSQPMKTSTQIQFLYFDGCPNASILEASLAEALTRSGADHPYQRIDLSSGSTDEPIMGFGSPTILVDGKDLFDSPASVAGHLSCRIYPDGLPDTETISLKLASKARE